MTNFLIKSFIKEYEKTSNEKIRSSYGTFASIIGIISNLLLFVVKIVVGLICGSVSIIADAVNNLSDASSTVVTFVGFRLSQKPADKDHPYGHGRYEYLSALGVSVVILIIGFELLKTSFDKIIHPTNVSFTIPLAIVLAASVFVKLWMMFFYKKIGNTINSKTLFATSVDSRNDVISTSVVILALLISKYTSINLDGYMGLLVALFIIISGVGLIKDTLDPMIGTIPEKEFVDDIAKKILSYEKVLGIHDLIVHDYGPMRKFASVHVEMAAEEDVIVSHDIIDNIETDFLNNDNLNLIIHYDPVLTKDPFVNEMKEYMKITVKKVDESLSIHDLRVVPGTTHTNIVFDCLASFDFKMTDNEIIEKLKEIVSQEKENYNLVIKVDRSYV